MVVLLCCYSYSSLAYDQQYTVGGTGPNGGVVTSVDVTSILTDQTTNQVGDFEEKTYIYTYTETVTEDVTSTNQITTTTYETVEQSTGDIINPTNLNDGTVTCTTQGTGVYYDGNGCDYHVSVWDDGHISTDGGFQFQTDLDNYLTKDEINYGFDVTGSNNVYNYNSTDTGTWSITLKVSDPTTGADYQKTQSWLLSSGYNNNLSTTLTVPENNFGSDAILYSTFYGVDPNGTTWNMTPANFNTTIDYYELTAIVSTIEQTIINSIQSSLDTIESNITQTYNPIVQPGTDTTTTTPIMKIEEPQKIEVKMETNSGTTMQFEVKVETTPTGTVNVSMADSTGKIEQIAEIKPLEMASTPEPKVELKIETKSESTSSSTTKPETKTETTTAKTETKTETKQESSKEEKKEDSKDNKKEDSKEEKDNKTTTVAEAKQKVATKILQQILSTTDAILINDTKLGLMIALADTENFAKYQAKKNALPLDWYEDEEIYTDMPQLLDPAGILYDMAQDKIMDEMIMEQYK